MVCCQNCTKRRQQVGYLYSRVHTSDVTNHLHAQQLTTSAFTPKLRSVQAGRLWFSWYATLSCRPWISCIILLWIPGWKKSGYQNRVLPIMGNQSTRGRAQAHFKPLLPPPLLTSQSRSHTAKFNTSVEGKYRTLQCYTPREEYFQNNNSNCHIRYHQLQNLSSHSLSCKNLCSEPVPA